MAHSIDDKGDGESMRKNDRCRCFEWHPRLHDIDNFTPLRGLAGSSAFDISDIGKCLLCGYRQKREW